MSKKLLHDEHIDLDGNRLHIASSSPDDFEVWLNTDDGDYDGLCIGCGQSRQEAITSAVEVLREGLGKLESAAAGAGD